MKDDDFDLKSKVEPLQKALMSLDGAVVITGRRNDQGNARTAVPIWEAEKNTFNPLVEWSWEVGTTDTRAYAAAPTERERGGGQTDRQREVCCGVLCHVGCRM